MKKITLITIVILLITMESIFSQSTKITTNYSMSNQSCDYELHDRKTRIFDFNTGSHVLKISNYTHDGKDFNGTINGYEIKDHIGDSKAVWFFCKAFDNDYIIIVHTDKQIYIYRIYDEVTTSHFVYGEL